MNNLISETKDTLVIKGKEYFFYSLPKLSRILNINLSRLPFSLRILLEGCLRNLGKSGFSMEAVNALANWQNNVSGDRPVIPFKPARVLLQDFTGLPVLNDLAALRSAVVKKGGNPDAVNPGIPCDLVIDHSLSIDKNASPDAREFNERIEFDINLERYRFLKWSESAFGNLHILPPGLGICHQVNLEYLGKVAFVKEDDNGSQIFPDTVLGTDSHTPMINGLGILGWGVGGIEALAAMMGYASEFPIPDVVGVELSGCLRDGVTPTDLTLTFSSHLREIGVVGKLVEVFGKGYASLPVETRAMCSNMTPESGSTATYCPVDINTLEYLKRTGRKKEQVDLSEIYFKAQDLFQENTTGQPEYSQIVKLDLSEVEPVIAGPKRPQDIFRLYTAKSSFEKILRTQKGIHGFGLDEEEINKQYKVELNVERHEIPQGAVLIAAITSCTNTSHPDVMIAAGLLARNAAAKGLRPKPWVKTSFAPGSRAVEEYLRSARLLTDLETLGFGVVGFGCTTCIGNSGPIDAALSKLVKDKGLVGTAVLSGNRNFEGRIHPDTLASFLASPPFVIAFALAGRAGFDFQSEPLGKDQKGRSVFLKDIMPSNNEIEKTVNDVVKAGVYIRNYDGLYKGNPRWNKLEVSESIVYSWSPEPTLLLEPAYLFEDENRQKSTEDINNAYALLMLGDSITTDHISPAGRIAADSVAGKYLISLGIKPEEFITFGARRGNHKLMERSIFGNARLRNRLVPETEGWFTCYLPSGEEMPIFDASKRYRSEGFPLIILAGKAYGSGSSRDWAAKGTYLLGVRAVIAESFERIHRTNLVCMGVLPLQFKSGENAELLGLSGEEKFTIRGIANIETLRPDLTVITEKFDGKRFDFKVSVLIDTPLEFDYFKSGGLARKVLADF